MTTRQVTRVARRLFRLCAPDGVTDAARARLVVGALARSGRRGADRIAATFLRLVRLELARRTATIESAVPLPDAVREDIRAGLVHAYGPALAASFSANPALIGGMRVTVGSEVFDASIRARLARLEAAL